MILTMDTPRGRFAYRDSRADRQADATVVFLHGWPESSACWEGVLTYLPSRYRYLRPDLRGMGDSERTPERSAYEKHQLAQDIITLLNELGVQECILVGHDWGGIVAQEIALAEPERVRKLVVLNISLIVNSQGNKLAQQKLRESGNRSLWYQTFMQIPQLAEAMIPGNEEVWLRTFLRSADVSRPYPEETFQEVLRTFRITGTAGSTANFYRSMKTDMNRWASLAGRRFAMPGLYIYGVLDPVIIPEYLEDAADCFPALDIVRIDNAAHFVQDEQPEAVAAAIRHFIEKP